MTINGKNTVIGFIGIGVMGKSMVSHLMTAGYKVHIYTRTKSTAESLLAKGAIWHETAGNVAAAADVTITIVGYPHDVEEIYLSEDGILANCSPGNIVIDMTTSSPKLAATIYNAARAKGISSLDAPVSGGDLGATNATLSIMVGGDKDTFDSISPVFQHMGKNIVFQGTAGSGQHCKMANQIAIASTMMGVCESIRYAEKAGLDPTTVLASIETGAAGSWSLTNLAPKMIKDDFAPGFYVKHFIKDMTIALDSSKDIGLSAKGLALAKSLYEEIAANGSDNLGTQALYKFYT